MKTQPQNKDFRRLRIFIRGIVQGVGFRPFVYSCAGQFGLSGFVRNDRAGVFVEIEGPEIFLAKFQNQLIENPPRLAEIFSIDSVEIERTLKTGFYIIDSEADGIAGTYVSPDVSVCEECLREIFDERDRRYRYPFTNCTNCGPRFTITESLPYDRAQTTMAGFEMCKLCYEEYSDPANRRFHAQPNACANCGPRLTFIYKDGREIADNEALISAQKTLSAGEIVAVKGIGGFHLACNALSEAAVRLLRERKGRVDKPFAVMCRDLATAGRYVEISRDEAGLLSSPARPIVLLKKRAGSDISALIAPGIDVLGVMLPYSPLHHLLLDTEPQQLEILVMTSGNFSQEPIVTDNDEARKKLEGLADAFLLHDRDIFVPCDDSVIRIFEGHELPLRRSRGYTPFPPELPFEVPPILAVGGELKATFCLAKGRSAIMSQHIGDMENLETLEAFAASVKHFRALFEVDPQIIAVDKHPQYLSSKWATDSLAQNFKPGSKIVKVQHHHAHIAAVMGENGLDGTEKVIGFAFDGTGYGDDGAIWGGEVMIATYSGFRRVAHLRYAPLAGGDASVRQPCRMALAYLWKSGVELADDLAPVAACGETEKRVLIKQFDSGFNIVPASSFGRLYDAVASIVGIRQSVTYEAQAAIEFESVLDKNTHEAYEFELTDGDPVEIDYAKLIKDVVLDVRKGATAGVVSAKFNNAVADVIWRLAQMFRERDDLKKVALSGGCFQNVALLGATKGRLVADGFEVFTHRIVPPNDGGLALGQVLVASQLAKNGS